VTQEKRIAQVNLEKQLQQRIKREKIVSQIAHKLHQTLEIKDILQTTVNEVRQFLQTDRVLIYQLQSSGWGIINTESVSEKYTALLSTSLYDPCLNKSHLKHFRQGLVTLKTDIYDGSINPCHVELLSKLEVRANLVVPILQNKQLWGLLIAHHCAGVRQWESLEVELLQDLAINLGIALQQAELYQQISAELRAHKKTEAKERAARKEAELANQKLHEYSQTLENKVAQRTEELLQAMEAAEVANRAKSTFLSQMSHEFRTPLNAILGFTQLIQRDASNLNLQQKEHLEIVNRNGKHLLKLINEVLDITKIESGEINLTEIDFDFYELLENICSIFAFEVNKKQIKLIVEPTARVPRWIKTDCSKLEQVLINLLDNAVKFTQSGSIKLEVDCEDQQILKFLMVDTGVGIDPSEITQLFKPFTQTESGIKLGKGTGLGLVICKRLVELLGGGIRIESIPEQGTKVFFSIQFQISNSLLSEFDKDSLDRSIVELNIPPSQYRVLVAEDCSENSLLLIQLLTKVGFEVKAVVDGFAAISLWQDWNPDLILMDLKMPVLDGYSAIKQIQQLCSPRNTKIIVITAEALETEQVATIEPYYDDLIIKPYCEAVLLKKIAHHLGVEYTYRPPEPSRSLNSFPLPGQITADSLKIMPTEWIEEIHQRANELDRNAILNLLELIPPQAINLKKSLSQLVLNFEFEIIIELSQLN